MLRRLASMAARGRGHGLPRPPHLLGAPSPAVPPAAGNPGSFTRNFSTDSPAGSSARRCVANLCTAAASQLMTTSSTGDSGKGDSTGQRKDLEPVAFGSTVQKIRAQSLDQDDRKLVDPDVYFQKHPILVDLDNKFVSDLGGVGRKKVPEDVCTTFHSLVDLVVTQHLNDNALGDALDEGNLLIDSETGEFVMKEVKENKLTPEREADEFVKVHDLIVKYVEKRHGVGSTALLPEDFTDFLKKLRAERLNGKLIYTHPIFLKWLDRVLFRTMSDICVRLPASDLKGSKGKDDLKRKLLKVIRSMPYVSQGMPGEDSKLTMEVIVDKNEVLKDVNKYREMEKEQREETKRMIAEGWKLHRQRKKAKKANRAAAATADGGGDGGGSEKRTSNAAAAKGRQGGEGHGGGGRRRGFATKSSKEPKSAAQLAQEEKAKNTGFRLIALNRDVFHHLYQVCKRLEKVISLEEMAEMVHAEFPTFEFKLLDLLEEERIWKNIHMDKILKVSPKKLEAIIRKDKIRFARYDAEKQEQKDRQNAVEAKAGS